MKRVKWKEGEINEGVQDISDVDYETYKERVELLEDLGKSKKGRKSKVKKDNEFDYEEKVKWKDIRDKYFRILIPDLESAIKWLKGLGLDIIKDDLGYWIEVNKTKQNPKPRR